MGVPFKVGMDNFVHMIKLVLKEIDDSSNALRLAANPDVGTLESISACRKALGEPCVRK